MKRIIDLVAEGNFIEINNIVEAKVAKILVNKINEEKEKFIESCRKKKEKGELFVTKSGSVTSSTSTGTSE